MPVNRLGTIIMRARNKKKGIARLAKIMKMFGTLHKIFGHLHQRTQLFETIIVVM